MIHIFSVTQTFKSLVFHNVSMKIETKLKEFNPFKIESKVCRKLNSNRINHKWKKDFKEEKFSIDWDLVNSEDVRIEVKCTQSLARFNQNCCTLHTLNQRKQIILKCLVNEYNQIMDYKFIKIINGEWLDITTEIIQ